MAETKSLRILLAEKNIPDDEITKFLSYTTDAKSNEKVAVEKAQRAGKQVPSTPVSNNTDADLFKIFNKFWNLRLTVDGVNVVITGKNMGMVTYHGYKNVVLAVYPEATFDVQLVREGDDVHFSKESGSVIYTHNIGDPFTTKPIIGAYCVIKTKRGEVLETLNKETFEKMKSKSKMEYIWREWESEFWLKSVLKRACKRHFNDITEAIDKVDTTDYGIDEGAEDDKQREAVDEKLKEIAAVTNLDELRDTWNGFGVWRKNTELYEAKEAKKTQLIALEDALESRE